MILADFQLSKWATEGGLDPFDPDLINPASVDLRLSNEVRVATAEGWTTELPFDRLVIKPNCVEVWVSWYPYKYDTSRPFILCSSLEYVRVPLWLEGEVCLKSTPGRKGLNHVLAGLVDPGFHGQLTFELFSVAPWPIELLPGQPIMQLVLSQMWREPNRGYGDTGRYQGQRGPTPPRPKREAK